MAEADPRSSGTYRAALAAVIILSVLLVAGLIAVAAGFVRQYRLYQARHPAPMAIAGTVSGAAASIVLAPGAHIVSATADAGKLVLQVQTPQGAEVDVMDMATGRLTAQVKDGLREDAPR
jgi:hypothetical protein